MNKHEWYISLFDELNEYWAEIVDARSTEKEVEFLENVIKTKGLLLDLCCGTGRHSILLSRKGWKVIGLDISASLLRIAKKKMSGKDIRLPLVRGEMRHLPFQSETFAAVINMFTSFGYLPSKKEDVKSLKEVARILQQDGSFLMDIANRDHVLNVFKKKDWGEFPHFYMLEKRALDVEGSRLYSQWIFVDKNSGKTRTFDHNLRLFSFPQL
ncbi:MAG: methyltransferase domain-containing protein, partial [Candidatus Bathyarchaeota archaeon]|nr:methyltransferase domain-containing protein [Candidatus Bathyarchaeota archaeon]